MSGETNLEILLQSMHPILQSEIFVFCTLSLEQFQALEQFQKLNLHPIGLFQEQEGLTIILPQSEADRVNFSYHFVCRMITLSVHSSLNAVGFLAAITAKLAEHQISVNPISAYYHDHLFVPIDRAEEAMLLLQKLAKQ
jgi:hypothetical protein